MKQNYFEMNGERYYSGTMFTIRYNNKLIDATFVCYITEYDRYVYKFNDLSGKEQTVFEPSKDFWNTMISVTGSRNNKIVGPTERRLRDRDIDGLILGWVWYIFLMVISTIFNEAIGLWIFISIVFFNWRSKKIKEEGTYIEW